MPWNNHNYRDYPTNGTTPVVWSNFVLFCSHVLIISPYIIGANLSIDRQNILQVNDYQADPDNNYDVTNINEVTRERSNHEPQPS